MSTTLQDWTLSNMFLVPCAIGFLAFAQWALVVNRMTNLRLRLRWRLATMAWAVFLLTTVGMDAVKDSHSVSSVIIKSFARGGHLAVGVVLYVMLARIYPERMAACMYEPTPSWWRHFHRLEGTCTSQPPQFSNTQRSY